MYMRYLLAISYHQLLRTMLLLVFVKTVMPGIGHANRFILLARGCLWILVKITRWFVLELRNTWISQYRHGVVVITIAQLHSAKPELRFCTGSNPACGLLEIRNGDDLWQWSRLEIRLNAFCQSTIPQKQIKSINQFLSFYHMLFFASVFSMNGECIYV